VIDGISRLDAAEKTGRTIVDEKGNWIGMLSDHVRHHAGKTDEEVWNIVHSLNDTRRHLRASQRAMVAAKRVELREFSANLRQTPSKRGRPEGRPSKGVKKAIQEEARKKNVSPRSVETARSILKEDDPVKIDAIISGKVSLHDAERETKAKARKHKPRKPKKELTFRERVWRKWNPWLQRWSPSERREVKAFVHEWTEPERKEGEKS
jgi:type IV secretory pathway VirB10-like protein